jgi:hypothetical protein
VEPNRRIEDLLRRYGYEENRVFRVLAVAVAILVVGGWLLLGPPTPSELIPPIPRHFLQRPGGEKRCCRHRGLRGEARIRGSGERTRATDGHVGG